MSSFAIIPEPSVSRVPACVELDSDKFGDEGIICPVMFGDEIGNVTSSVM